MVPGTPQFAFIILLLFVVNSGPATKLFLRRMLTLKFSIPAIIDRILVRHVAILQ